MGMIKIALRNFDLSGSKHHDMVDKNTVREPGKTLKKTWRRQAMLVFRLHYFDQTRHGTSL